MLLESAGYITLKQGKSFDATLDDIEKNDRSFAISAYPESELPNRYKEFSSDLIVMNSKTAVSAGYSVNKYSITIEAIDSLAAKENASVLLINSAEASGEQITSVKELFFSPLMYDLIDDSPKSIIVPAFEISPMKIASPTTDANR
jgi:ABC-type metal ion transport system substrate-binding protein